MPVLAALRLVCNCSRKTHTRYSTSGTPDSLRNGFDDLCRALPLDEFASLHRCRLDGVRSLDHIRHRQLGTSHDGQDHTFCVAATSVILRAVTSLRKSPATPSRLTLPRPRSVAFVTRAIRPSCRVGRADRALFGSDEKLNIFRRGLEGLVICPTGDMSGLLP